MTDQHFHRPKAIGSFLMASAAFTLPLAVSCGDGGGGTGSTDEGGGSVTIVSDPLTLPIRSETSLMVVVKDQEGELLSGKVVDFSSSKTDVATVTAEGVVTAVGQGASDHHSFSWRKECLSTCLREDSRVCYDHRWLAPHLRSESLWQRLLLGGQQRRPARSRIRFAGLCRTDPDPRFQVRAFRLVSS